MEEVFRSTIAYDPARPGALAISCSDGRFAKAVNELLLCEGHGNIDTLTLPGGVALLSYTSATHSERDAVRRALQFMFLHHDIRRVFLIGHHGCAYYREHLRGMSVESIERRQLEDLRDSARAVARLRPGLRLDLYFARIQGDSVVFEHTDGS